MLGKLFFRGKRFASPTKTLNNLKGGKKMLFEENFKSVKFWKNYWGV